MEYNSNNIAIINELLKIKLDMKACFSALSAYFNAVAANMHDQTIITDFNSKYGR
jgi:hypothetical protein